MDRVRAVFIRCLENLVGVLFMAISGVTLAEVFCRYALGFSLTWSHEIVILLLIWIVWLCVPIGLERGDHLAVTVLVDRLSARARARLGWVNWALALFFVGLVFLLSFPVADAFEGMWLLTVPVPTNARYYAATVGSFLSLLVLLFRLWPRGSRA